MDDFTDQEVISTIVRIKGGNFRVIHRLLVQDSGQSSRVFCPAARIEIIQESPERSGIAKGIRHEASACDWTDPTAEQETYLS